MDMDMDMDMELGIENLYFNPTDYCLWYIASPGQQLDKKLLYHQQVVDTFCLTIGDLEILQRESVTKLFFRQINDSLLLALEPVAIIWNNSVCYVSYNDDISSKMFEDFAIAAESWVSSGLPFDNSLVIQAALRLIYEGVQDQVQKLKSRVENCWCFSRTLCDLRKKESLLSSKSKKVMVEIFDTGSPGGVAVFLEPKQLQECRKPWNSIPEQLDNIRATLNKKLQRCENMMVLIIVFGLVLSAVGLLMVAVTLPIPLYKVVSYVLIVLFILRFIVPNMRFCLEKSLL